MKKLLIFLIIFHLLANLVWISLDKSPLSWDQAGHTLTSLQFLDFFKAQSGTVFLKISNYYPPLVYIIVALGMFFLGPSLSLGPMVVTGLFLLAIVFLYLYTKELLSDEKIALTAAALFSFLPPLYSHSRTFLLDIPLLAMILGSLYFLEKSNRVGNYKNSVLSAAFFGAALLTKWVAVIYLFIPVLLKLKKQLIVLIIFATFILISLPWYIINFTNLTSRARVSLTAEISDPQALLSLQNSTYYLSVLANFYLTWLGLILLFAAIPVFIYFKKEKGILITTVGIFIYLIFTFIPNKDPRYILPILPFVSIAVAFLLVKIIRLNKLWGVGLSIITGSYFLLYFFSLSFGWPFDPEKIDYQRAFKLPVIGWVDYINLGKKTSRYLAPKFETISWPHQQIIADLSSKNPEILTKILILVDKGELNARNLELYQKEQKNSSIKFWAPYDLNQFSNVSKMEAYLAYFDYVLIADKSFGPEDVLRHLPVLKQLKEHLINLSPEKVGLLTAYDLPDGDRVSLYEIKF